jgi:CRP-like cAMP-binding protein
VARSDLDAEAQDAILALPVAPRKVGARQEIVRLGEHVSHSCLVAEGLVGRFAQMADGRRQLVAFHIAGDMVDLYSMMLPASPSPLVALAPTTILQVPHSALREAALRHPTLAAALWRECVIDGIIVAEWLVSVGRRDARGRIAHLLCEVASRYERIGMLQWGRFPLPTTQEQLADAVGLTTVHVNRSIKALREEGLVELSRHEATILDWPGLIQEAEFDPAYLHLPPPADTARFATPRAG